MIDQSSIEKLAQHNLAFNSLQQLVVELDEQNEELLLGGCFACEDPLRPRFKRSDETTIISSQYGIRSIPTLMF